ncbi:PREDICTED: protein prenyltransferase alpha subunit repeat-containing protein 1 [Cyprinodon variegatus]|uniref:protein prenyltransferase alpha subunit repeat-containing protein 1 n=1 Tax=Cyprinodon variegatus TaxID=28743 RepID=UPI00074294EA|nr:PREDICTED: protein prenyltransferase alpha subunit repeat-containing protein 1 [Cyprinodon variegatus]
MAESKEEVDVLVQRVVKDISSAFKRHPNIDEIGLIQCPEARYNRSPIVLVENKLGVESWCVKFLLPYVHNKLLLYRQRKHWLDREALVDITCTLLLLNPDFTTAWNVRKELLQCGALNPERDLYLSKLALTKFPKSPETWIHRRWVLQHILHQMSAVVHKAQQQVEAEPPDAERTHLLNNHLDRLIHQEMKVCSDAACRYPSNYNAWSHRIWVLQHMAKGDIKVGLLDEAAAVKLPRSFLIEGFIGQAFRVILDALFSWSITCFYRVIKYFFSNKMQFYASLSPRRHVFYLYHQWKQDQHPCSDGRESELNLLGTSDPAGSRQTGASLEDSRVDRRRHVGVPMEVDGVSFPDHDSKRLRRGGLLPSLQNEHTFINSTLNSSCNPEQKNFALVYRKWLDTVVSAQS